mmetsp:Transcript_32144/g.55516  ORF Transcript_32144/g.55516 Transcript_32144/m.55516 type:complete len:344 (+) Transcript_32144:74-1105(+)
MAQLLSTKMSSVNIISESGRFEQDILRSYLPSEARDCHAIAIIGSQNKGKSTILNRIFGTAFATLPAGQFQQTTKGIHAVVLDNLLILDVEGFDSYERHDQEVSRATEEDKTGVEANIEAKLNLFILMVADVIVINVLANDICCASGLKLLENILKDYKSLKQSNPSIKRKKILYFVRDFSRNSCPGDVIRNKINDNFKKACSRCSFSEAELADSFELQVHPVVNYEMPQFQQDVDNLKTMFRSDELYADSRLLNTQDMCEVYGFIWDSVRKCEGVNMPNIRSFVLDLKFRQLQQMMLLEFKREADKHSTKGSSSLEASLRTLSQKYESDFNSAGKRLIIDFS